MNQVGASNMKSPTIRGAFSTTLVDIFNNKIEEGDLIAYFPTSKWSQPIACKVVKLIEDNIELLCICNNGIYYSSVYINNRSILLKKSNNSLTNFDYNFDERGNIIN